ncbi:hypothetical protein AB5I41_23080 [Sphingomonas sp. MMS24-JH45]
MTFVVIRLWDERRLVVPVSKFLEQSFQNWTRETSALMGSVFWQLDPATDIERMRATLEALVRANPRWDGRFYNLQVTDMKAHAIEVRALMTRTRARRSTCAPTCASRCWRGCGWRCRRRCPGGG